VGRWAPQRHDLLQVGACRLRARRALDDGVRGAIVVLWRLRGWRRWS
jgi:hypothetical protein